MADPDYSTEIWKTIPVAPAYEASSLGRIRRTEATSRNAARHLMSPSPNLKGYLQIPLRIDGKSLTQRVHRLVCLTFHGPPPPGQPEAAHRDGNKLNNREDNLRWSSHRENIDDAMRHKSRRYAVGSRHQNSKLTEEVVREIRAAEPRPFLTRELGEKFGISPSTVEKLRTPSSRKTSWLHV